MSAREAADQLHLMPDYVSILERDDYEALRSPAFARGYLKAYCRLLDLDEGELLPLFDQLNEEGETRQKKRIETKPLQLQRTGIGVVTGLFVLLLLFWALWWWRGDAGEAAPAVNDNAAPQAELSQPIFGGESE